MANADGSGVKAIGDRDAWARQNPEWSPSGDWIAYMAWPSEGASANRRHPPRRDRRPSPARRPTARVRAFAAGSSGRRTSRTDSLYAIGARDEEAAEGFNLGDAIATMDVDTGVETIVSDEPGVTEHRPAWSPDGSQIAIPPRRPDRGHPSRRHRAPGPQGHVGRLDRRGHPTASGSTGSPRATSGGSDRCRRQPRTDPDPPQGSRGRRLHLAAARAVDPSSQVCERPRFAGVSSRLARQQHAT